METIYGYLERITFYNEENSFIVAKIQERGKHELTTIVGNLAGLSPGETLKLSGQWVHNNKYGDQFQVEKCEALAPATVNGIEKYLGSGLIAGIGPVMAKRIVRVFGPETLDIIENQPEALSRVEGIGAKRIAMISKAWQEQKEIKEIMIFLQGHGVSANYSARIFKQYGSAAIEVVKNNPYQLAADVRGIGFATADKIAREMGIDPNSVTRAKEGAVFVLNQQMDEGHVYFPYEPLIDRTAELLDIDREIVVRAIAELFAEGRIILEDIGDPGTDSLPNQKAVYLPAFHTSETNLAERLLFLDTGRPYNRPVDIEAVITWVENKLHIRLAEKQREAVFFAVQNKVSIITGGPGTGKTTIIRSIVNIFQLMGLRILLAAPTGRAAKRMQEATGYEAKTIHRLLEFSYQKGGFQKNQDFPLQADVVILDEASMIDTILMYHLVKAVPPDAALILVGDVNQLPSVGPGSVFSDIINSGRFKVITLNEIFRQAKESRIIVNAHLINQGMFPDIRTPLDGEQADFYFIEENDPEKALQKILSLCKVRIPKHFGYHPVRDIQVLTPMHRGDVGVSTLNVRLQEILNPHGKKLVRGYKSFAVNDKVMQIVNNYDKEVYNGDIGLVTGINQEDQEITVNFDGKEVLYSAQDLEELVLAYAISIHKSQGSEYPAVVIPVMTQHYILLQRNLIYTGITRGKKLVILVGSKKALSIAVRNNKTQSRHTLLRERLINAVDYQGLQPGVLIPGSYL